MMYGCLNARKALRFKTGSLVCSIQTSLVCSISIKVLLTSFLRFLITFHMSWQKAGFILSSNCLSPNFKSISINPQNIQLQISHHTSHVHGVKTVLVLRPNCPLTNFRSTSINPQNIWEVLTFQLPFGICRLAIWRTLARQYDTAGIV